MRTRLIQSGTVYDVTLGCEGQIRDIAVCEDRIIALDEVARVDEVVDASGLVVTPAAVDCAAHVAFPGVWHLQASGLFPDTETIALRYTQRGFGHVHESWTTLEHAGTVRSAWARVPSLNVSIGLCLSLYDLIGWIEAQDVRAAGTAVERLCQVLGLRGLYLPEPGLRFRNEIYKHREKSPEELLPFLLEAFGSLQGPFMVPARALAAEVAKGSLSGLHGQRITEFLEQDAPSNQAVNHVLRSDIGGDLGLPWPENGVQLRWRREASGIKGPRWDLGTHLFLQAEPLPEKDFRDDEAAMALMLKAKEKGWAFSCRHANLALVQDWKALVEAVLSVWTIKDWLLATRLHAAKALGFEDKGHLCPGAQADIAMYPQPEEDTPAGWAHAFSTCERLYIKGKLVYDASRGDRVLRAKTEPVQSPKKRDVNRELLSAFFEGLSLRPETLTRLVAGRRPQTGCVLTA